MPKRKQRHQSHSLTDSARISASPAVALGGVAARSGSRSTALLFAPAVLAGALLLFAVQPLIARFVLPWFGGGPGVWTTCMLFFQTLLLGGYLYAHLSVRYLGVRWQIILHLVLLIGSLTLIPIIPSPRWKPVSADDPAGRILLLLAATIGLPYFVLSATSPLLQAWFVKVRPGISPYRLFALSNLGSLLALLGYPTVLEPLFSRRQQAWIWSVGLIAFAAVCTLCGVHVWRRLPRTAPTAALSDDSGNSADAPAGRRYLLWLALPMVASVLLLAVTNTVTEDVAVTPMLWVVPLALYLLTFVIAFDSPRWYPRRAVLILLPVCTLWMIRLKCGPVLKLDVTLPEQFVAYLASMFVMCLFCHGELAELKPHPRELTKYYLTIAVGGALGGVFVALLAPHFFNRLLELPLGVLAAAALGFFCLRHVRVHRHRLWTGLFAGAAVLFLIGVPLLERLLAPGGGHAIERSRNFYGTLVVADLDAEKPADRMRLLNHGGTSHGAQFLEPARRKETTLYYREGSGVSFAMHHFPRAENRRIGLVGLGVGTLAAYSKPGDTLRFYEINPDVERAARRYFTFLADAPGQTDVILGDARLTLEREEPQQFDILVLDAFSGDAIPTHLLTAEAFDGYVRHLKPDGVVAVHFSNRSVDLGPLLLRQARRLNMTAAVGDPRAGWWMLMSRDDAFLNSPAMRQGTRVVPTSDRGPLWTDDHVNLLSVIRWIPDAAAKP